MGTKDTDTHIVITLCDGAEARISRAVILQDPRWQEGLHRMYAARSAALYGRGIHPRPGLRGRA